MVRKRSGAVFKKLKKVANKRKVRKKPKKAKKVKKKASKKKTTKTKRKTASKKRIKKKIKKKIPRKEMNLALRSAIGATGDRDVVAGRGHLIEDVPDLPLVVVDDVMGLQKTKEVEGFLLSLGAWADVFRAGKSTC